MRVHKVCDCLCSVLVRGGVRGCTNLCMTATQMHTRALRSSRLRVKACCLARLSRWARRHFAGNSPESSRRPRLLHQSDPSAPFAYLPSPLSGNQLADPVHVMLAGTQAHPLWRWSIAQWPAHCCCVYLIGSIRS